MNWNYRILWCLQNGLEAAIWHKRKYQNWQRYVMIKFGSRISLVGKTLSKNYYLGTASKTGNLPSCLVFSPSITLSSVSTASNTGNSLSTFIFSSSVGSSSSSPFFCFLWLKNVEMGIFSPDSIDLFVVVLELPSVF